MKNKVKTHLFLLVLIMIVSCNKDEGIDDLGHAGDNPISTISPSELSPGYAFIRYLNMKEKDPNRIREVIFIKEGGYLQHSSSFDEQNYRTPTGYTYQKTGESTAKFTFSIEQRINGPIRHRYWTREGEITFLGDKLCEFEYREKYWADGTLTLDQNYKETYYFGHQTEFGLQWNIQ